MIKSAVSTAVVHVDHVRQELTIQTKHSSYNNGLCSYFYSCANVCLLIIDHHYVFLCQGQAPHPYTYMHWVTWESWHSCVMHCTRQQLFVLRLYLGLFHLAPCTYIVGEWKIHSASSGCCIMWMPYFCMATSMLQPTDQAICLWLDVALVNFKVLPLNYVSWPPRYITTLFYSVSNALCKKISVGAWTQVHIHQLQLRAHTKLR